MNNNYPLISIIIVNYNGKHLLKECFDALMDINYPKDRQEIFMVDNCSDDGSVQFVQESYPEIKIINNNINNYCMANNLGIKNSKGEYVAVLNNDTKVDKNWLIELVKIISSDNKIGAAGSKILFMDGRIESIGHKELPDFYWIDNGCKENDSGQYNKIDTASSLCGCAVIYRKKAIEDVGYFDEDFNMYMEDVDISMRLKEQKWELVYIPQSLVFHMHHGTSNDALSFFYTERNRLLLVAKHYPDKLNNALLGSGYFTAKKDIRASGEIYNVLSDIVLKLIKHHKMEVVKKVLDELFAELKKILNYENHLLANKIEEFTNANESQLSLIKEKDTYIGNLHVEIAKRDGMLKEKEVYINSLHAEIAKRDGMLKEKEVYINSLHAEIAKRDGMLKEKEVYINSLHAEIAKKDGALKEKEVYINSLHAEIAKRDNALKEKDIYINSLNSELVKIANTLISKEAEIRNINDRIGELDIQISNRDLAISSRDQELTNRAIAIRNMALEINNKDIEIRNRDKKISDIYNSTAFKFIVNPLWKFLWVLKFNNRKGEVVKQSKDSDDTDAAKQSNDLDKIDLIANLQSRGDGVCPMVSENQTTNPKSEEYAIFTICSKNHLAYARILAESFLEHNECKVFVLLADAVDGYFDEKAEKFTLITLDTIKDRIPNFDSFCFQYNIYELSTSVKPFFLEFLFEKYGLKKLIFFDPDILITNNLHELIESLDKYSVILIPHITMPFPDKNKPSEVHILKSGVYNLGFIALSYTENTKILLNWWKKRLQRFGFNDLENGLFVDQKWIDLIPGFFEDVHVLRDKTYNIAYWNYHYRKAYMDGSRILVDGKPVNFLHFSGFDISDLNSVSKNQNRYQLSDLAGMQPIFELYKNKLISKGYNESKNWPSKYGCFDNGAKITDLIRKIYCELNDNDKRRFGNPSMVSGENSYFNWLNGAIDYKIPRITQLMYHIYKKRLDLQSLYRDILNCDRAAFISWFVISSKQEYNLDDIFLRL